MEQVSPDLGRFHLAWTTSQETDIFLLTRIISLYLSTYLPTYRPIYLPIYKTLHFSCYSRSLDMARGRLARWAWGKKKEEKYMISLQIKEFRIMGLSINDSVYGCVFFFLTGLHFLCP